MTYNALIPLNSDSPAVFPAQSQANFTRLQTLLGADHQFNLTAAADDGYHNVVHLTQQAPSGHIKSSSAQWWPIWYIPPISLQSSGFVSTHSPVQQAQSDGVGGGKIPLLGPVCALDPPRSS